MNKNCFLSLVKLCVFFLFAINANNLFAQQTLNYSYDALGRMVIENDTVNGNRNFAYDAAGNRTQVNVDAAPPPAIPAAPTGLSWTRINANTWIANWHSDGTATSYVVTTSAGSVTVSVTNATVPAIPLTVKACNVSGCSAPANF